jgi:hypothetical protein
MKRSFLSFIFAIGCDYEAPLVPPIDANGDAIAVKNVISGELVLADADAVLGTVLVFVTDSANPMPPTGTGRPVTFAAVPSSAFTGDAAGIQSAPFSVSNIPDGDWVVTAVMDVDGNFHPLTSALAGATCGDVGGAHLTDWESGELASVSVAGGVLVDDVTIVLGSTFPFERPASTIDNYGEGGEAIDSAEAAVNTLSQVYALESMAVNSELLELGGPEDFDAGECGAIFPLYAPDADGDGEFDPHPTYGDLGLYDIWPRVYLQFLGTPIEADGRVTFENELAVGESWAAENVPNPTYAIFGTAQPGQTAFLDRLEALWLPGARHTTTTAEDGAVTSETVTDVSLIPKGAWSVTVITHTGQTWSLPNDLYRYEPTVGSFDPDSQKQWLDVQ